MCVVYATFCPVYSTLVDVLCVCVYRCDPPGVCMPQFVPCTLVDTVCERVKCSYCRRVPTGVCGQRGGPALAQPLSRPLVCQSTLGLLLYLSLIPSN